MENKVTLLNMFTKEGLGEIRVASLNGEVLFNLYDACFDLGYTKEAKGNLYLRKDLIASICKNIGVTGLSVGDNFREITLATDFENTWISESNLYELCLESKAKNARLFRKWVTGEVLPTIRKTGSFTSKEIPLFEDKLEHLKLEQQGLKFVLDLIKPSQSSTVKMLRDFNESQGLTTAYLPIYVDEQVGISVSSLLKEFNINLSAVKFNELLIKHGILEVQQRKSTTNVSGFRDYKVLTDKGLEYGKNEISTRGSEKQSQPLYYKSKFQELLNLVNCEVAM